MFCCYTSQKPPYISLPLSTRVSKTLDPLLLLLLLQTLNKKPPYISLPLSARVSKTLDPLLLLLLQTLTDCRSSKKINGGRSDRIDFDFVFFISFPSFIGAFESPRPCSDSDRQQAPRHLRSARERVDDRSAAGGCGREPEQRQIERS